MNRYVYEVQEYCLGLWVHPTMWWFSCVSCMWNLIGKQGLPWSCMWNFIGKLGCLSLTLTCARCMSACMPFPCCTRDPIPKLLYAARLRWEITFHGTHDHIQLKLLTIQGEKLPGHLKIASKCHMPRDYIGWEITLTGWEITWDGNLSCLTWLHLKAICQETIQDRKFYWHT